MIENQLLVEAPGGNVILSASAVNQINGGLIKQSGKINVGSTTTIAKNEAGRIMISSNKVELGSQSQTLASAEQQGGEITIQANDIDITNKGFQEEKLEYQKMLDCLKAFDETDKIILAMLGAGHSYTEIQEVVSDISMANLRVKANRARIKLAQCMDRKL